jgi:ABC-2 type transport system permease protein
MPLTMIVLVSFFAAFAAIGEPDGTLAEVLTFIPFCTPMIAPVRLIAGDVAAWEIAVAVALMLATTAALAAAAVRIYGNAVLRGGGRVKLAEAWRAV